ncbi:hypothetical protein N0V90_007386 [Kalmusia sp. IMI 367209]|nr:hypothetical protein N0V90_007386 [Kalmusia sp. IMI 367209]
MRARPRPRPRIDFDTAINIDDANRLLEWSQIERQRQFQHLVRRYMSQILYGCTSTYCTTPTCLSCNKRLVSKPFRPPTQLTARALAFYLASQDHPHRRLCPHELNVDPSTLEIEGADGVHLRKEGGSVGTVCHVYPRAPSPASTARAKGTFESGCDHGVEHVAETKRISDAIENRHQSRKDPKSLGQNLYDTVTMIFAYSKHIPNPLLPLFASLASSSDQELPTSGGSLRHASMIVIEGKRQQDSHQVPPTNPASANTTPPPVNNERDSEPTSTQSPKRFERRPSKVNASHITSEVLSNGQRIHKIRHVASGLGNDLHSYKPSNVSSLNGTLDGTLDGVIAEKLKMRTPHAFTNMPRKSSTSALLSEHSSDKSNASVESSRDELHSTVPVISHLTCDIMDQLKEEVCRQPRNRSRDFNFVVDYDANRRFRPAKPFVNRSLYFTLSDPETLLKSFRDMNSDEYKDSPLPHLDAYCLTHSFRDWNQRNGALVFDSLWIALEALFRPPPELDTQKSPRLKPSRKAAALQQASQQPDQNENSASMPGRYLSNLEAAHIIMICIHALTALVPFGWPHTWVQVRKLRGWGVVIPGAPPKTAHADSFAHPWLEIIDHLEYEPAIRLATRLLQAIGTRRCFEHILQSIRTGDGTFRQTESSSGPNSLIPILTRHLEQVEKAALQRKAKMISSQSNNDDPGWTVTATFMEWLRTVVVKQWDGNVEINAWGSVGTAVAIMNYLHTFMDDLNLQPEMFLIPCFSEQIDSIQQPLDFLKYKELPNSFHVLQHPFLFPQDILVGYFRAINFNRMFKQFEKSARIINFQSRWDQIVNDRRHWDVVMDHLDVALTEYLVLDVSRQNPLEATLDQLWGQEKRKLLKPLKVRIGILEGEVGLDQGGVTYEFFRLVLSEAFRPDNGMFVVDAQTSMTWFQPASLEPLWKFEMLGVIFSLAVYNGIVLPVTFPLALYKYLLKDESKPSERISPTDYIADGWPVLAKSFRELLDFPGEVADVFLRDYTFSFAVFGQNVDVDMRAFKGRAWPDISFDSENTITSMQRKFQLYPDLDSSSWRRPKDMESEPALVTNANRKEYISDYVDWLTFTSVHPQLEAFAKGFHTCLRHTSLKFFTPRTLRALVEGGHTISIPLLRKTVRYEDGYSAYHHTIVDFWSIVEKYNEEDRKRLLEFVTANERIPVTGYDSIHFSIVRMGGDTENLPTSSTCFGKLWLPEYRSREKLKTKLGVAIRNSEGFGIV